MMKTIEIKCRSCKEASKFDITTKQWLSIKRGELIQNVLPNLSVDERELFISKTCGTCYDRMFAEG
jgi:hypothetical protein